MHFTESHWIMKSASFSFRTLSRISTKAEIWKGTGSPDDWRCCIQAKSKRVETANQIYFKEGRWSHIWDHLCHYTTNNKGNSYWIPSTDGCIKNLWETLLFPPIDANSATGKLRGMKNLSIVQHLSTSETMLLHMSFVWVKKCSHHVPEGNKCSLNISHVTIYNCVRRQYLRLFEVTTRAPFPYLGNIEFVEELIQLIGCEIAIFIHRLLNVWETSLR